MQTGSAMSGASMTSFLKNQDCPKIPLCNRDTSTSNVNGSTDGETELYAGFYKRKPLSSHFQYFLRMNMFV